MAGRKDVMKVVAMVGCWAVAMVESMAAKKVALKVDYWVSWSVGSTAVE